VKSWTSVVGQFPEMRFEGKISFPEILLSNNLTPALTLPRPLAKRAAWTVIVPNKVSLSMYLRK